MFLYHQRTAADRQTIKTVLYSYLQQWRLNINYTPNMPYQLAYTKGV